MPVLYDHDHENEVTLFAETNFRNQQRRFGIKTDDRRRHMYVLGKTGMGKTTLLENMVLSDILAGHGVAYIDPHGDTAEKILDYIPSSRINDVVYFNPADMEFPVGFNILETTNEEQKHLVASGLMGVFKKIWPDVWSPRMEYILLNCVLALLDYPGATLLGINRLLVDKEYRSRVIAKIRNPIVKTFWVAEFTSWSEKYATEAIAPVQNKVGQFLSASIIRNIVAQVKSTINPREIMDQGKIFIVNLSKGKIGEDNMRLLGGMIVTKIQLAAMERVDIKNENDRRDFYLFVDEFQNFANESFANVLSEARKYHLNLIVAHQYIEQLEEEVRDAVFGNVGSMLMFRVGAPDATFLETEFDPVFTPADLTNLAKFEIYLKLMVDGVSTQPFSAKTLAPIAKRTGSEEKVIAVSRERYAEPKAVIEQKVLRWSGMESGPVAEPELLPNTTAVPGLQYPSIMTEDEQAAREALGGTPASMKPGTPEYAAAGVAALEGNAGTTDTGEFLRISPERMAALAKPGQQQKKEKPKFKHTCTRCGKTWDMPIQLDPTRPMFCAECMPIVREERKGKEKFIKQAVRPSTQTDFQPTETFSSAPPALDAAMRDMEEGRPMATSTRPRSATAPVVNATPPPPNRPRIVVTDKEKLERLTGEDEDEERSALMDDISRTKGKTMETRKQAVMPAREPVAVAAPVPAKPVVPPAPRPRVERAPSDAPRREAPASRPPRRPDERGPRTDRPAGNTAPNRPRIARDEEARPVPGNRPVIVRADDVPKPTSRVETPVLGADRPSKVKRSLEDVFGEVEERTDRIITSHSSPPSVPELEDAPSHDDSPAIVFRSRSSSVHPTEAPSSSGPRSMSPGQRVQF